MDPRRLLPSFFALTACAVLATVTLLLTTQRSSAPPARASTSTTPFTAPSTTPSTTPSTPREALAEWDSRRAEAWAAGDVSALRELYVAGSPTGREDVRMLSAYADRGLRVVGLTTQVLALEVLEESAGALVVRVTDRVVGGVVSGKGTSAALPHDRATTRTVTMRRVEGVWRIAAVRDQASAAASTSRTSSSWKS